MYQHTPTKYGTTLSFGHDFPNRGKRMREISKVSQQTQSHGTAQVNCAINDACHFAPMTQIIIRCICLNRDREREREIRGAREGVKEVAGKRDSEEENRRERGRGEGRESERDRGNCVYSMALGVLIQ